MLESCLPGPSQTRQDAGSTCSMHLSWQDEPGPGRLHTPVRPHPRSRAAAAARLPPREVTHLSTHSLTRSIHYSRQLSLFTLLLLSIRECSPSTIHSFVHSLARWRWSPKPRPAVPLQKGPPVSFPLSSFPRFHHHLQPFSSTSLSRPGHPVAWSCSSVLFLSRRQNLPSPKSACLTHLDKAHNYLKCIPLLYGT